MIAGPGFEKLEGHEADARNGLGDVSSVGAGVAVCHVLLLIDDPTH